MQYGVEILQTCSIPTWVPTSRLLCPWSLNYCYEMDMAIVTFLNLLVHNCRNTFQILQPSQNFSYYLFYFELSKTMPTRNQLRHEHNPKPRFHWHNIRTSSEAFYYPAPESLAIKYFSGEP